MRRHQKNLTIDKKYISFIEENFGKMNIRQIADSIGVTYNKLHNNLRVMGKVKTKTQIPVKVSSKKFDADDFFKNYKF